jgi:hypothetical protein
MISKFGIWQTRRLDFGLKPRGSIFEDKYNPRGFDSKARMPGQPKPNFEVISVYSSEYFLLTRNAVNFFFLHHSYHSIVHIIILLLDLHGSPPL